MATTKLTTGLARLPVAKNPHHLLGVIYGRTLRALAKMPQDYPYRMNTESLVNKRAEFVKSTACVADLEKKIGSGHIEEVIIQADNELLLSRKILEWRSWEPLSGAAPANQWKWPL
ncbi:NADH dehydrogenase [ubiquinone] 1 alpha subcomplex subunit 5 [Lepeophtheirus salmonis]|uniref:NADH dehydrogenase 1 alpha subcomplex subunit 5 n=1 Tax=Lepeophtheirus salmonis TaxID=72036 RepID=C1BSD5_LEPSM|nr:NADH dehydrogenase [ubiquinone] 1 alpha subcomplex subunit 5-like [Lepeophtheirus salmonis]ACO11938.1 NADH dehydrogenase 1 alpha subcomplex subunit 5 [Lepeophtheirus salmonis]